MGTKPVDLNIHRALVQAVAECIIMKAPDQILFIADFLEKLNSASPAFEQQRQIHEDCTNFSTDPLMDLCDALEAAHSSRESYIHRIMTVLGNFVLASRSMDTSHPNIVHYKVRSGSSELDLPVNLSETPEEVTNLVQIIVSHLNHL